MARRIDINGRFLTSPASGVQRVARELVRALDQVGDTQGWRLLVPRGADPEFRLANIQRAEIPGPPGQLWEQVALPGAAKDAVLLNLANTAPLSHPRNVVLFHDAQVHDTPQSYSRAFRTWYRFLQPRLAKRAAAVMAVSRFSADRLAHHRVAERGRIEIVHNGIDHVLRTPADPSILARKNLTAGRYALGIASAQAHKNVGLLLQLFAQPRADGLQLALAGGGLPDGATLPGDHVRLLGRVSDGELRALYENAAVFLSPSTTEGFGLPAGEAMLLGCPAIVADAGAQAEVWGEAALMAKPDDAPRWREHLDRIADPAFRAGRAEAGRAVASTFTWARSANDLRTILDRVASQN